MSSLLRQIAQYFHEKSNLQDYCFVMPNHRSGKFLERELSLTAKGTFIMPEVLTINDFVSQLSKGVNVDMIDALFLLHKCYTALPGNSGYELDKFVYWGNVVLNDFNDVDMDLIDPAQIFNNVREHREIQANYIDKDLQEIMKAYFNLNQQGIASDEEEFWANYDDPSLDPEQVKAKYLALWRNLQPLYNAFNQELDNLGVKTRGRIYRDAVKAVKDGRDLGHECYVFVGFNVLSASELAIFKILSNRKKAMFFWDTASPIFSDKFPPNAGTTFVKFLQEQFPQPDDFTTSRASSFPPINVWGIPSGVGQAKCAFKIVDDMIAKKVINDPLNAIDTAIVAPDESLLLPLLNSVSNDIKNINVTMAYPLHASDIASLMRVVSIMHQRARRNENLQWQFYRDDVRTVLSHTIIKSCFANHALQLTHRIDSENLRYITEDMTHGMEIEPLFKAIDDTSPSSAVEFLERMADFCQTVLKVISNHYDDIDDEDNNNAQPSITIQEAFINQYIEVLNRVASGIEKYKLPTSENTVFFLVDKMASIFSVPLEGEPLKGLQMMGMLETRCLDFNNVIILSANERVIPRKPRSNSFITDFMRRAYGMSTSFDQEAMWAYYFYRLLARAQNIYLLYDTSTQAMGSGEVTRFVNQLKMVYGCPMSEERLSMNVPASKPLTINVPKDKHVMQIINSYAAGGTKSLSASSINEFINCPLSFYFRHIEGLDADSTDEDFMGNSEFGTIVHDTLQQLYYPDVDGEQRQGQYKVSGAVIREFRDKHLNHNVAQMVNKVYTKNADINTPLSGEAAIVSDAIAMYVRNALNYDIELLAGDNNYFTVLECERKHSNITLNFGSKEFNFTYTADRIDLLPDGKTLRIVDYKTGTDSTSATNIENLFIPKKGRAKAILQLFLYCNAYAKENDYNGPIMPVIYKLRKMEETGVKISTKITNYLDVNKEFSGNMNKVISDFFDKDIPFSQADYSKPQEAPCRYCKFVNFCHRNNMDSSSY
ncbi:MAG: PD-(D/E)XK nuclease family protein [Muribaculaceae bacterium]|nr:PD-(D/E)XK nuclease family protein [Muribaculaceae bacterium]